MFSIYVGCVKKKFFGFVIRYYCYNVFIYYFILLTKKPCTNNICAHGGGKNNMKSKKKKINAIFCLNGRTIFGDTSFYIIFTELRNVLNIIDFCNRFVNNIENVFFLFLFIHAKKIFFSLNRCQTVRVITWLKNILCTD